MTGIDTKPAESLALMLESIGHEVKMLTDQAIERYNREGYTGGVTQNLLKSMGYSEARIEMVDTVDDADMFVDLKKHDLDSMLKLRPHLKGLLYVINGGADGYDNWGKYYPTITNNFWIDNAFQVWSPPVDGLEPDPTIERTEPPIDLLHSARGWGFRSWINKIMDATGVRIHGDGDSPHPKLQNTEVGDYLKKSLCFLHIKASDCPGWALYEAFSTATPVVVPDLFVARMKFPDLYIDGETCMTWGKTLFKQDKKDPKIITEFIDQEMPQAIEEMKEIMEKLKDPEFNRKIGEAGHKKWKELTEWTPKKQEALKQYLKQWSEQ